MTGYHTSPYQPCTTPTCSHHTMHSSGLCAACRRKQEDPDDRPQKCAQILVWLGEHGFERTDATRYNRIRFVRGNVVVTLNEATVFIARCEDGRYTNTFQRDIMEVALKQIAKRIQQTEKK